MKSCQRNWAEVFGEEANMFAVSPSNTYQKVRAKPFGRFCYYLNLYSFPFYHNTVRNTVCEAVLLFICTLF